MYQGGYDLRIVNIDGEELSTFPNTVVSESNATVLAWKLDYSPLGVTTINWTIQVRVMEKIEKAIPSGMVEGLIGA